MGSLRSPNVALQDFPVEIFQKERPQLSLIDIHMPYSPIDGVETLENTAL